MPRGKTLLMQGTSDVDWLTCLSLGGRGCCTVSDAIHRLRWLQRCVLRKLIEFHEMLESLQSVTFGIQLGGAKKRVL